MGTVRRIKRYSNRKLYDMTESRYVTLEEVGQFVQDGDEVQIIDNRTKEDITSVTLAQIVYEQEKKKNFLPLHTLKGIIRSSGQLFQRKIAEPMALLRDDAERTMNTLRADAERKVTTIREEAERALGYLRERGEAGVLVREITETTQKAYEDFARAVDDGFKQMMRGMRQQESRSVWKKDVERRLQELDRRVRELEARAGGPDHG